MSIMTTIPAVSTHADASDLAWSNRFDKAQAEFRRRNGKPVALVVAVEITPPPADPLDLSNLDCYRDGFDVEVSRARLAKISARLAETERLLDDHPFSDELLEVVARDTSDVPSDEPADFSTDERWDEVWTVEPPAPLTNDDLLTKTFEIHPLDGPVRRRADADDLARAYEVGYSLGSEGWSVKDVAPCSAWTAAEASHFVMGLEAGENRLWDDVARDREELDRMSGLYVPEEHELAYAGSAVGHMA